MSSDIIIEICFKLCYTHVNRSDHLKDFIFKLAKFMEGRYGVDELTKALFVLWFILELIWVISHFWLVGLLVLIVMFLIAYRSLSKNIQMRMYENRKFLDFSKKVSSFTDLLSKKWKDRKTHRYVKCPYCKAQLRVKKVRGKHTVHCPKCNEDFKKRIII